MPRKRWTEEQIIFEVKQSEAGRKAVEICRELEVSEHTFYTWKRRHEARTRAWTANQWHKGECWRPVDAARKECFGVVTAIGVDAAGRRGDDERSCSPASTRFNSLRS